MRPFFARGHYDVTSYRALQRAVRGTVTRCGAIDVAIASAGICTSSGS